MRTGSFRRTRGFTLIESLITIAVLVITLAVGVSSFSRYIVDNRLKAVSTQLVTDLQWARSEAALRNKPVFITTKRNPGNTYCYTIYTSDLLTGECNCLAGAGNACTSAGLRELRTVSVLHSEKVDLAPITYRSFPFDHITGGIFYGTIDYATDPTTDQEIQVRVVGDTSARKVRVLVSPAGRPRMCSSGTQRMWDLPTC